MAVIKAVSSKAPISTVIDYVSKDEKTEDKLLSGYNLTSPDTAKDEMQATKELWGKTGGRTYKHFVQSFAPDEDITPQQAHELAVKFAEQCPQFKGFEVLIATHQDREHIHTHFVLNSVNFEDGHKFQMKSNELQEMKDLSDKLCAERGLSITKKGKTFHGEDREETTAYSKEQYQLLQSAEKGKAQSYVQDIALAVLQCRTEATSIEDFKRRMSECGYAVKWEDSRKYITFTDVTRQEKGEKKCSIRNNKLEQYYNIDFSKEGLEREFESNTRKQAEQLAEQAKQDRACAILGTRGFAEEISRGQGGVIDRTTEERESRSGDTAIADSITNANRGNDTAMRIIGQRNADKAKREAERARARKAAAARAEQAAKEAAARRSSYSRGR